MRAAAAVTVIWCTADGLRRRPSLQQSRLILASLSWLWAEKHNCSVAPTAAASAPRRCTPPSPPPSSTTSTRRLGSPMCLPASPGCPTPGCTSCCPRTGKPPGARPRPRRPALTSRHVFEPPGSAGQASRPAVLTRWVQSGVRSCSAVPGRDARITCPPTAMMSCQPTRRRGWCEVRRATATPVPTSLRRRQIATNRRRRTAGSSRGSRSTPESAPSLAVQFTILT